MKNRALNVYIWATCLAAGLLALGLDWASLGPLSGAHFRGLGTLIVLGILADSRPLTVKVGQNTGGSSIAFLPVLSIVLLFGPAATVLSMLITGIVVEHLVRRKEAYRANFNIGQYTLSTVVAGYTYTAAGGHGLMLLPDGVKPSSMWGQLGPFILWGVVFLVLNNTLVAGAISFSQRLDFRDVWRKLVGPSGTHILYDLLIAPMAIAVAALYVQVGIPGLILTIFPLYFIRHSYLTTQQLQQANQDLLRALVKAIETRDPYTSGHSLRVSHLARRIAERMEFASAVIDRIETAALLHDVGKIEALYAEILAKPESLSREERAVIESHVTKGEELLRKLASVPEDVILAVRHHHERQDGGGYPDGLTGTDIPVGARIIGVCDAVDAMLSNRPYRRALSVPAVLQQLRAHSGTQFDPTIVETVLSTELIGEYADIMRASGNSDWVEQRVEGTPLPYGGVPGGVPMPAPRRSRRHLRSLSS